MKYFVFAAAMGTIAAGIALSIEQASLISDSPGLPRSLDPAEAAVRVHAAGRVEGTTETIAMRPFFAGRVESIDAPRGTRVKRGDPLLSLVSQRYAAQRDLAAAALEEARARKMRLIEGARESEIESARQEALAAEARHQRAQNNFRRAERLRERNAISGQEFDALKEQADAARALLQAARERLATISAPPRETELMKADAAIRAAHAQLEMAEIDLQRCRLTAPCDAVVLDVGPHPGEWYSPEMDEPAVELANTERLRVVADVDEHDAMKVRLGQRCEITADALPQEKFSGVVSEIQPRMEPKRIYGGWAGERNETHARRIWIDLQNSPELPVGLPVEIMISPSGG